MTNKVAVAYIPVLHRGYVEFLTHCREEDVTDLYLIGDDILTSHEELDYIHRKDRLRALTVEEMREAIRAICDLQVSVLTKENISLLQKERATIITPKEDVGRIVINAYFGDHTVEDYSVFVRWNKDNINIESEPESESLPMSEFQEKIVSLMKEESAKSFDWWRHVGSALIQGEDIIYVTHNTHMPEEQQSYIDGDTRSLFKKGININYSTAAHAEVVALGRAAKEGVITNGAELYVTDFPCPYCARLIASAGIKTVYFLSGYAVLEGDTYLKNEGVQVVKLKE